MQGHFPSPLPPSPPPISALSDQLKKCRRIHASGETGATLVLGLLFFVCYPAVCSCCCCLCSRAIGLDELVPRLIFRSQNDLRSSFAESMSTIESTPKALVPSLPSPSRTASHCAAAAQHPSLLPRPLDIFPPPLCTEEHRHGP